MTLFQPSSLGPLTLRNRFVRSATWEGMAGEDGSCTPRLVDLTAELARGEVGLIISSHAFVSPEGQAGPWQLAVHSDRFTVGYDHVRSCGLLVSRCRDAQRVRAGLDAHEAKRPLFAGQDAQGRARDLDRGLTHGKAVGCGAHRAFDHPASGLGGKTAGLPQEPGRRDPQGEGPAD